MFSGGEILEWNVREQGTRVIIEVRKRDKGNGLYKAWAVGVTGKCLLGTLIPEEGWLTLHRTMPVDSLKIRGAWPIRRVEEELVYSFQEQLVMIQWEDEVLRQSTHNMPQCTMRKEGDGFTLYFPFDPHMPFPLLPVFCFARVENGRLVFSFLKGGIPNIFQNHGKDKKEV